MGPSALAQVLRPLAQYDAPNLLVGLKASDDAAVYRLDDTTAIVQTVDFFPPVVDDPYTFGAIAAANAMSDVFAMGGQVLLALNVAAFPNDQPLEILQEIFRGGADKVAEAGGVIAGGHTITDREPKYGLCVTGIANPHRLLTKAGARVGDVLVLTKPLGTGVITTALRAEAAAREHLEAAITSMLKLNRRASELALEVGVNACTDVTGFGLLGHAAEMADASGVGMRFSLASIPLLPGALEGARGNMFPGGTWRNRNHLVPLDPKDGPPRVRWSRRLDQNLVDLLFDPETSGGLLLAVAPEKAPELTSLLSREGEGCFVIGEVTGGNIIAVE